MAAFLAEAGAIRHRDGNLVTRPVETLCAFLRSERVDFWRLLDRDKRKAYLSRWDQVFLIFAPVEPEDHKRVFVDGFLMSPGSEDYKVAARPETLERLRQFLDAQFGRMHDSA